MSTRDTEVALRAALIHVLDELTVIQGLAKQLGSSDRAAKTVEITDNAILFTAGVLEE